ncbi:MAG: aminotransferase class I/II-fold pyridoxal phosphate-dependent enzyme, partial [Phycisphaeraceae bacterium]|nr:aminotransferase class I/II-fold pyridoxal phosphate-dependent enzyme [Phycisphaeraceae bacterium]
MRHSYVLMIYERANIRQMAGYVPGEQPEDGSVVKLNTNENPYPPAEGVMAVLRDFPADRLRRYPNPTAANFRGLAAKVHGLKPENVLATNGGDELLRLLVTTFIPPGGVLAMAEPSYSLYPVLADVQGARTLRIPLKDDWSLPGEGDFADKANDGGAALTIVVNPHAPSGRLTTVSDLADLAKRLRGVLVVDEAYVDFVDPDLRHDATQLVRTLPNVLLLRTLSKGYSLAGLRFGYGLGPPGIIEPMLTKTKDSYNTDALSQALAEEALSNRDAASKTWQAVRSERQRLTQALIQRGFEIPPSQSNFILPKPPAQGPNASALYESLKNQRIFVRYFDQDRLRDRLRITLGSPEQNT